MTVAGTAGSIVLGGCSAATTAQFSRIGLQPPASDRAPYMEHLWQGGWIAAMVIGVMTWFLIGYAALHFRRKKGDPDTPRQTKYHLPLELLYTLVPILIVVVLWVYTVRAQHAVLSESQKPAHTVNVVGQMWSWTFNYEEQDNPAVGTVVHQVGTMENYPDLYLVYNQPVKFHLQSADVAHSFWVPAFYFKLDVLPGHPNTFELTPTRLGTFDGKCAELCGTYHAKMLFTVHVVTQAEFDKHMQELKAAGQTGEYDGNNEPNVIPTPSAEVTGR